MQQEEPGDEPRPQHGATHQEVLARTGGNQPHVLLLAHCRELLKQKLWHLSCASLALPSPTSYCSEFSSPHPRALTYSREEAIQEEGQVRGLVD